MTENRFGLTEKSSIEELEQAYETISLKNKEIYLNIIKENDDLTEVYNLIIDEYKKFCISKEILNNLAIEMKKAYKKPLILEIIFTILLFVPFAISLRWISIGAHIKNISIYKKTIKELDEIPNKLSKQHECGFWEVVPFVDKETKKIIKYAADNGCDYETAKNDLHNA